MPLILTMIHVFWRSSALLEVVLRDEECGMKKVLVAVDGSDKSLEAADYAMSIVNKEHAQLIILNVLNTEPWFYGQSAYRWATEDELRKVYADEILEKDIRQYKGKS